MSGSRKLFIEGPAGKLESLWRSGETHEASGRAAIICHPHPMFGGTMENKVVSRCARSLSEAGIAAIRFNFRGVGQSEGKYDGGRGEREDLRAVIAEILRSIPTVRLAVVGFSFGAWVAMSEGADHPAVRALVALAPPLAMFDFTSAASSPKPKLVVYAEQDQFTSTELMRSWLPTVAEPITSLAIPQADHFFTEQIDFVAVKVAEFVSNVL